MMSNFHLYQEQQQQHLRSFLGPLGQILVHLGPPWADLGPSWADLGPSWADLGPSATDLGPILAHLGRILGWSWVNLGWLWVDLGLILVWSWFDLKTRLWSLKSLKSLSNQSIKWIALSGFLGTFFPAFLFAYAETEIDSAIASILNSIVPINTILFGFLVFKITSTKRQVFGVLIGFIGFDLVLMGFNRCWCCLYLFNWFLMCF